MIVKTEKVHINYKGREVSAKKLTVASHLPINIEVAWTKVQTIDLLQFVAKGMIGFVPTKEKFPAVFQENSTVTAQMKFYGFLPLGGTHTLFFEKIDHENKILYTKEYDEVAKVWNHKISMKKIDENTTYYEDEIVIYGGILTSLIVFWATLFYKHRQKRWQLVAKEK
ncbi:MAG: hypothetical protein MUE81_03080 [Thermoflexibacter sp.]|jgi:hypothetical protein|nr:hypothetical protein [Thermoflexibacter sp.]